MNSITFASLINTYDISVGISNDLWRHVVKEIVTTIYPPHQLIYVSIAEYIRRNYE